MEQMVKGKDTKIFFYCSRGPGGQRKNRKKTAVKIVHIPTGITVRATEHRLQYQNIQLAFKRLKEKLKIQRQVKKRRIPTRKPHYVKKSEMKRKKMHGEKKEARRKVTDYDNGSNNT
jgi:ribosome-associated protein